jgi:hypothetical protein
MIDWNKPLAFQKFGTPVQVERVVDFARRAICSWRLPAGDLVADVISRDDARFHNPPPAPRDWWLNVWGSGKRYFYASKEACEAECGDGNCMHVREVLP